MKNNKPHGLSGKPSNAAKPEAEKKTALVQMRVDADTKNKWVSKAQKNNLKLTNYIENNMEMAEIFSDIVVDNEKKLFEHSTQVKALALERILLRAEYIDDVMVIRPGSVLSFAAKTKIETDQKIERLIQMEAKTTKSSIDEIKENLKNILAFEAPTCFAMLREHWGDRF